MTGVHTQSGTETVHVRVPMNDHGAMCVEVEADNATRQVVDYESEELKRTLGSLPEGTSIPLAMERLSDRGNVWRALDVRRGRTTSPTPSAT